MKPFITLILTLLPTIAISGEYEDYFEKGGNSKDPYSFYEDVRKDDGKYDVIDKNYEHVDQKDVDMSDIPKNMIDDGKDNDREGGRNLGESVKGRISNENSLLGIMKGMQNNTPLETLGDTFICPSDNETYDDLLTCNKTCWPPCEKYKFSVELSCQKSTEIMKITPDHIGMNPSFTIKFRDTAYKTGKVLGVCGNGFMDMDNKSYEWTVDSITKSLSFTIPYSNKTLGACTYMSEPFMSSFVKYLEPMAFAIKGHLGQLGFVASHEINSDMSLSIKVLSAGSCDEGILASGLPNANAIDNLKQGKLGFWEAQSIANTDPNYQFLTDGRNVSAQTCAVTYGVNLYSNSKTSNEVLVFKGELPDVTKKDKGSTHVYNNGTLIGIVQNGRYEKDYLSEITERFLSSSLEIGAFTASNGDTFIGCPGNPLPDGTSCKIEDRWINSTVPYSFSVTVEKTMSEEVFNVSQNNGCLSILKGCKLESETVCDMRGGTCVNTIANGMKTGFIVPKMCNELSTSEDYYSVCSDGKTITAKGKHNSFSAAGGFFNTTKRYACEDKSSKEEFDYSSFLEQDNKIAGSVKFSDIGDVSFSAIGKGGKEETYNLNLTPNNTKCIQSCKVRKPADTTDQIIMSDGSLSKPKPVAMQTSFYKPCDKSEDKWVCNLSADETKISDCDCPDDFMDMIIQMKFIDESAKSMKCSGK